MLQLTWDCRIEWTSFFASKYTGLSCWKYVYQSHRKEKRWKQEIKEQEETKEQEEQESNIHRKDRRPPNQADNRIKNPKERNKTPNTVTRKKEAEAIWGSCCCHCQCHRHWRSISWLQVGCWGASLLPSVSLSWRLGSASRTPWWLLPRSSMKSKTGTIKLLQAVAGGVIWVVKATLSCWFGGCWCCCLWLIAGGWWCRREISWSSGARLSCVWRLEMISR